MFFFEVSAVMAFVQGLLSFLTPCVLPLVPAYLSYLTGSSLDRLSEDRWRLLRNSAFYCLGFTLVFVAMGATATAIGSFLARYSDVLRIGSGILVILFGVIMLDVIPIKALSRERRFMTKPGKTGILPSLVMGMAFAFGWTPCIGPVLSAVLVMAASAATVWQGIGLLLAYSAGMALPFILIALFINALRRPLDALKKHSLLVRRISAVLLIIMGILLVTDSFTLLANL